MAARRMMNRLYYFTIEDETILAEAFDQLDKEVYAISYKVAGTEDVFVTTSAPQRVYDSRPGFPPTTGVPVSNLVKFPISANQDRVLSVVSTVGAFVTAVLLTVTVVNTNSAGFLAVLQGSGTWGSPTQFSSMNWYENGQILANSVVSAVNSSGQVKVHCGGTGFTDFVVDLVGAWVIP